ncbi:MAG: SusC/RagA family TonB-linked outer membrane protein, partial [Sphingobacteriaceae bacterium]
MTSRLLLPTSVYAQSNTTVKGRITGEKQEPVARVSVTVKGTNTGTTTNDNGEYQILAPSNATLVISTIGYNTQEMPVRGQTTLNITLSTASTTNLDQVVVVGYGTQRKKDITGSVTSVNLEVQRNAPNTNIGQFLQGAAPGLNVGVSNVAGGTPPISIRGINTISGSTNVLIILDGIQYTQSLSSINPDDIASIDVLKDASSTAVYGAQAANGVILITSRRGRSGTPRISLSTTYTTQRPTVNLRPRNRDEFLEDVRQAYYDTTYLRPDYLTPRANYNIAANVDPTNRYNIATLKPYNTDWWGDGTNTGLISETNLSISGGSDRFNYLLSGGLVDQRGFIINDKFKRKTLRANLETKPLSWWKVGLISSGSFVNQDGAEPLIGLLVQTSPLLRPYDSLTGALIPYPANTLSPNPFTTYFVDNFDRNNYYFANVYSDIDFPFLKGLNYRMNFGNNYRE